MEGPFSLENQGQVVVRRTHIRAQTSTALDTQRLPEQRFGFLVVLFPIQTFSEIRHALRD